MDGSWAVRIEACNGVRRTMRDYRLTLGFVALAALTSFVHCQNKTSASKEKSCSGAQALTQLGFKGSSLPAKTIAFTFDDGPGDRTKALSTYLKEQGIQAAFFVNGRQFGIGAQEILQQLVDDGHLVGNHTETHRSLTGQATQTPRPSDAEIVQELTDTDTKIDPFVPSKRFLFRPPFGDYDGQTAATLAPTPMNKYVGPIYWDVGYKMNEAAEQAADWDCWQDGSDGKRLTVKACGDLYIADIKHAGRGIVLMHDPYFNDQDPAQEGTYEMVMYMVPLLKEAGFKFTRVDKVPEIAALLPELPPDPPPGGAPGVAGSSGENGAAPGGGGGGDDPCK
jgi:peptidoglycan-N-acetylglucosamine deacetylase